MDTDAAVAVWEALADEGAPPDLQAGDWPGVADPDALRAQLADWLAQYANAGTRRTYAYALGLPVAWVDLIGGVPAPAKPATTPPPAPARPAAPPRLVPLVRRARPRPPRRHRTRRQGLAARPRRRRREPADPPADALHAVGALRPSHRDRRGRGQPGGAAPRPPRPVQHRPGRLPHRPAHRRPARGAARAAGGLPHTRDPRLRRLYATRAVAFVALLTLGLRISELVGLDRGDLYRSGGDDVLRVLGKGGHHREVYVTELVATAVASTWRSATGSPTRPCRLGGAAPRRVRALVATRDGGRCSRADLYTLLRRIAAHAGPELDGVADRVHPHALRHAYVTIALEQDARIQHVQADVGHASIATTQHYDRGLRTRATTAADLVAAAIAAAGPGSNDQQVSGSEP